jgi:transposase
LEPDSDETKALRALTRAREDLVHARVALTNQLRAELDRFWPGPIGLFAKLDSPISLAFLEKYPSPPDARALGEKRLQAFLAARRYSGHKKPTELLAKLRRAPEGRVGEAELAARRALVLALVTAIKPLVDQIKQLDRQIASALREHPDGEIFLSLFRDPRSVVTAAELLSEIGDCRARYPTRDALAGDAGQAAVAIESGKRKTASFRWGCNKRLRSAFCTLADTTRHWHPWAQDRYAAARARGHDHPRALRTLGRAWCRIVWQVLAEPHPIQPSPPPRPATARPGHDPDIVGPCARPCCHPADARRRRHRNGGPAGPSAQRLTASRHPLTRSGVDVMKGRAGSGGPGGRKSALRPELRSSRPRGLRPRGRTIREEDRP